MILILLHYLNVYVILSCESHMITLSQPNPAIKEHKMTVFHWVNQVTTDYDNKCYLSLSAYSVGQSSVNRGLKLEVCFIFFSHSDLIYVTHFISACPTNLHQASPLHEDLHSENSHHSVKSYAGGLQTHKTWQTFWNNPWQDEIWEPLEDTQNYLCSLEVIWWLSQPLKYRRGRLSAEAARGRLTGQKCSPRETQSEVITREGGVINPTEMDTELF